MLRSVDSESERHAIERRKTFRRSLCCSPSGGHVAAPYWSGASSSAGVEEHAQTDNGGSPGTWEILHVSSADSRLELPGDQLQASAVHSSAGERKQRVEPRYRQAKVTKRGGMDGRKSQHPRSTDEAGELVPRDPVEERKNRKGVPDVGTWAGNYVRGFVLGNTYHRHDPG